MTYIVTDICIKCKYMDCVEVCPVDCFHEGENMLVIDPEVCIDCGVCEPECPIDAIISEDKAPSPQAQADGVEFNKKYAALWPVITLKGTAPADADDWVNVPDKQRDHFDPTPGAGDD
jgi:ferredoxin